MLSKCPLLLHLQQESFCYSDAMTTTARKTFRLTPTTIEAFSGWLDNHRWAQEGEFVDALLRWVVRNPPELPEILGLSALIDKIEGEFDATRKKDDQDEKGKKRG